MEVLVRRSAARGTRPDRAGSRCARGLLPCLLAALLVAGCGQAGPDGGNVLAGQVVGEEGEALADATVYVFASGGEAPLAEATTGGDGRFSVALADAGPVDVRVGRAWRRHSDEDHTIWLTLTAEELAVSPRGPPLRIVAVADPCECTVRVRVTSTEGNVARARVRAVPTVWPRDEAWRWTGRHTNDIGRVDLVELPRVPVELRVLCEPPWCPARGPVVLPDPRGIDLHRILVERARILTGRVLDAGGEPVVGCGVMATSSRATASRAWGDLTGADGAFAVGVPESWDEATLLVGCEEPTETSAHRLAVPVRTESPAAIEVRLEARGEPAPAAAGAGEDAVRAVMEAVLRGHYVAREGQDRVVVVRELQGMRKAEEATTYLKEGVDVSALTDLAGKAEVDAVLPSGLDVGLPLLVLPGAWWRSFEETHGWQVWRQLRRRYPGGGGVIWLSHVGFSEDGAQAVMHVVHMRGSRNGDGHYYLLEKRGDAWHVVRRAMTWIT